MPSLHRESTDSLIYLDVGTMRMYIHCMYACKHAADYRFCNDFVYIVVGISTSFKKKFY